MLVGDLSNRCQKRVIELLPRPSHTPSLSYPSHVWFIFSVLAFMIGSVRWLLRLPGLLVEASSSAMETFPHLNRNTRLEEIFRDANFCGIDGSRINLREEGPLFLGRVRTLPQRAPEACASGCFQKLHHVTSFPRYAHQLLRQARSLHLMYLITISNAKSASGPGCFGKQLRDHVLSSLPRT